MFNPTKQKRPKEVIILGWSVLSFAAYIFYKSVLILGEYLILPFSLEDILTKSTFDFKITFIFLILTHIFSILLLIAVIGVLYLKRWAFVLLIFVFVLDFIKRFYILITLTGNFNVIFTIEIVLLLLAVYCFSRTKIRETLK